MGGWREVKTWCIECSKCKTGCDQVSFEEPPLPKGWSYTGQRIRPTGYAGAIAIAEVLCYECNSDNFRRGKA